jgi:hypothetical protein
MNAKLVASISPAPLLTDLQTPYYEALSYAWGAAGRYGDVLYIKGEGFLSMTSTLGKALKRLKYPD